MKKLIGIAAVALTLAASAFAEISFSLGTAFLMAPVASDGDRIRTVMQNPWGGALRIIDLGISGKNEDETVGFSAAIRQNGDGTGPTIGDRVMAWWQPIDQLKFAFGKFDGPDNELIEGNGDFGLWDWMRVAATCVPASGVFNGDDGIFDGKAGDGFMAFVMPVEGLKFVVNIPFIYYNKDGEEGEKKAQSHVTDAWHAYKYTMINAAYTIGDVGTIKAGWWFKSEEDDNDNDYIGRLGVAFDLTAVENLYIALGAKFDFADTDYANAKTDDMLSTARIALNASYRIANRLTISLAGGVNILKADDFDPVFGIGGGVSFDITDALTVLADVRYHSSVKYTGATKIETDDALSFLVGIQYAFSSNVNVGIGFEGVTNGGGSSKNGSRLGLSDMPAANSDFMWAVPIRVSLSI